MLLSHELWAQIPIPADELKPQKKAPALENTVTMYTRAIRDTKGNRRIDESFVGDFRVLNWLKLQAGIRFGEEPQHLDAYYHYKLELSSKFFYNRIRGIVRISDNVINYFPSAYRKTNELVIAEFRQPFSRALQIRVAFGYLFSWRSPTPEALPVNTGMNVNYPVFRISMMYTTKTKTSYELVYGSYDVFNPYDYKQPFMQASVEQELSKRTAIFSYFRYQYDLDVFRPLNYFLCFGVERSLDKK
ncbi:MAG TPA: hypothetical protein VNB90_16620 [Cytophagaceae bacterium]|nr:hypothetical protein [Cytophagaceae bacterium]